MTAAYNEVEMTEKFPSIKKKLLYNNNFSNKICFVNVVELLMNANNHDEITLNVCVSCVLSVLNLGTIHMKKN